jgi:Mg-chelatase subunit ChlI
MGVQGLTVTTFQEAVDLRLESGLGKLSTLRCLHTVDLGSSEQRMQEEEIVWMLEHWKSLEKIRGRFNFQEPEVERALRERLQARNVEVSPDFYDDEDTSEDEDEDENDMIAQDNEDEEQTAVQNESQEDDEDSDDDDFYYDASEDGDEGQEVFQDENLAAIKGQSQQDDEDSNDEEWWSS